MWQNQYYYYMCGISSAWIKWNYSWKQGRNENIIYRRLSLMRTKGKARKIQFRPIVRHTQTVQLEHQINCGLNQHVKYTIIFNHIVKSCANVGVGKRVKKGKKNVLFTKFWARRVCTVPVCLLYVFNKKTTVRFTRFYQIHILISYLSQILNLSAQSNARKLTCLCFYLYLVAQLKALSQNVTKAQKAQFIHWGLIKTANSIHKISNFPAENHQQHQKHTR
jgi:hypothetical protein